MNKIKEFFKDIIFDVELVFFLFIIIFGYPFYKKSLKEAWEIILKHFN